MKKIMITCDEATTLSDKKQYREVSYWERIKLSFHLMMCKKCMVYDEQNAVITKVLANKTANEKLEQAKLSKKEKTQMKDTIKP